MDRNVNDNTLKRMRTCKKWELQKSDCSDVVCREKSVDVKKSKKMSRRAAATPASRSSDVTSRVLSRHRARHGPDHLQGNCKGPSRQRTRGTLTSTAANFEILKVELGEARGRLTYHLIPFYTGWWIFTVTILSYSEEDYE